MTVAKALGCGLPIGAFLCKEKAAALEAGDHGSTYGGNPLVCAAASKILDIFRQDHILDHVKEAGAYLYDQLEQLKNRHQDKIVDHRGVGLIQGLEFTVPVGPIIQRAMNKGLILISAEANTIRFLPPLIVEKTHIDEMIRILEQSI